MPRHSVPFHLALSLVFLGTHALLVASVPSDTGSLIPAALAELPDDLGTDISNLMVSMDMTDQNTHFSRLVSPDVGDPGDPKAVNQSLVLMKFPTLENDFTMSFIKLTSDLNPNDTHVVLVCGHTAPSKCGNASPHYGAPLDHPCGPEDASDLATGPFCEAISLEHESTADGELLMHGSFVVESVKNSYATNQAAYEIPTIHLEVVDTKSFQALIASDVDADDVAIQNALATGDLRELDDALQMRVDDADDADDAGVEVRLDEDDDDGTNVDDDDTDDDPGGTRKLLRIGGVGGGIRGGGMRGGVGGVGGRFGGIGGLGQGVGGRRGRNMAVNQVMAANFYGNKGKGRGGQAAYFNDPGIAGGR